MPVNRTRAALYVLCIARAGYRDGATLIEFIEQWRIQVARAETSITVEEFIAGNVRYGRRRTFQVLALFRKTFPQLGADGLPDGLMGPLLERLAAEAEAAHEFGAELGTAT